MDADRIAIVCEKHKDLVDVYFSNDGKKIYTMIDQILFRLKFDVDKDEFYSLGNVVFLDALCVYDEAQDFNGFLYSCLYKKFCTCMTENTRDKRCTKIEIEKVDENGNRIRIKEVVPDIRMDAPISDEDASTFGDMIASPNSVENEIFGKENREEWHKEVIDYINNLSPMQKKIAYYISEGFSPEEICDVLNIEMRHYINSVNRIFSDEKIKTLRTLVERK